MRIIITTILFCFVSLLYAQPKEKLNFQHFSIKEGLSQTTVYDMVQDKYGQLWIATGDGLNKYNGSQFTVFRNNRRDTTSLLDNTIRCICFDTQNFLWIGTQKGLSRYDMEMGRFTNYPFLEKGLKVNVIDILEMGNGNYLLGTNIGLYSFSEKEGYVKLSSPDNVRISVLKRFKNTVLLGTDQGLYTYSPASNHYEQSHEQLCEKPIMAIETYLNDQNKVWLGTEGYGLYLLDLSYKTLTQYRHNPNDNKSLSSDYVRSLCYDANYRLWIGTFVGLNISTDKEGVFDRYFHDPYEIETLSQSSIRTIISDSQGGMWCGTYFGGINYYHPLRGRFVNYRNKKDQNSISDNVVSVMQVDKYNNLWIGTNENGLNYFDQMQNHFTHYKHQANNSLSIPSNNVKTLLSATGEDLWVGTHGGGLSYFSKANGTFKRMHISDNKTANDEVYSLARALNHKIWIGTIDGLFIYDEKNNTVTPFNKDAYGNALTDKQIMSLYVDRRNRIWIGTDNGVNKYYQEGNRLEPFADSLQNNGSICCIAQDKKGTIWLGARTGLFRYEESQNRLIDMAEEIGFPEIAIYGIQEDNTGSMWISSSHGLIMFKPQTQKWIIYTEEDGIQSNQFSIFSYCKDRNGRMFFGGVNGLTSFNPELIPLNTFAPTPLLDRFMLANQVVVPGDKTGILAKSIWDIDKIKLKPDQSIFTINFSVPNFLAGNNNNFAYKLDGFDAEWIYTKKGSAQYSNLQPGKYHFMVKASNNDGVWSDNMAALEIVILPHWWETWWAMIIFGILIIGTIVLVVNIYTARKFMKRELDIERKEKTQNEALSESKIRFFINISHEFRTPLTLILSPLHEMLSRGVTDRWQKEQLEHIQRNAKRMMHLINQVLDYRRSELGAMTLHIAKKNIVTDVQEIFELFVPITQSKHIHYYFHNNVTSKELYYDANFLERILSNLISNAIKYTTSDDTIDVTIEERDQKLILVVQDTGCGIPLEKQQFIFERFYQVEETARGTGIGLSMVKNLVETHLGTISVRSTPNEGSIFTVVLPCTIDAYPQSVIYSNALLDNKTETDHSIIVRDLEYMHDIQNNVEKETASAQVQTIDEADKTKRLLLVEDDEEVRNYLQENFAQYYKVVTAENGKNALACLEKNPEIDLIVSDVMMPVMDGIKLCKFVKQNICYSHIPVILLTAKSDISAQLDGLQSGADDYISKPFVFAVLHAKIINLFKTRNTLLLRYSTAQEPDIAELATNTIDQEFLQKAIAVIEKNMENPDFSTEDFSREMGMSRSNLYLKLKALTNESAVVFIRRIRFNYACKLLKEGRYNVSEISAMVGFTPSYFATSFKKHMGCMPSEYVKNLSI